METSFTAAGTEVPPGDVPVRCRAGKFSSFFFKLSSKSKVPVHAMKVYGGLKVWLHLLLTSALDGGEWSSRPRRFTSGKETR
jgi:hypothetical protein